MRVQGLVAGISFVAIFHASIAWSTHTGAGSPTRWISDALDHAGAEWTALPRTEVDRCVASFQSESHSMLEAVASTPIDLSRPTTVVYVVGQGFASTAISVIGSDKRGKTAIAFDDLSSHESRTVSRVLANRIEALVSATLHGKLTAFAGTLDGECTLIIRKGESRLFPPGYGAAKGNEDALKQLNIAINEAFSTSAAEAEF